MSLSLSLFFPLGAKNHKAIFIANVTNLTQRGKVLEAPVILT